jgi:hypothetical protein
MPDRVLTEEPLQFGDGERLFGILTLSSVPGRRAKELPVFVILSAELQTAGAALAGCMAGVPVLCKVATAGERSDLGKIENTGSSGWLVAWLTRAVIGTWVATTAAVVDALVQAGVKPGRIAQIPNGVELPTGLSTRPFPYGVRHFLYLGRLSANSERDVPRWLGPLIDWPQNTRTWNWPLWVMATCLRKPGDWQKASPREIASICRASTGRKNGWRGRIASYCHRGEKVCPMRCWKPWRLAFPALRTTFHRTERCWITAKPACWCRWKIATPSKLQCGTWSKIMERREISP